MINLRWQLRVGKIFCTRRFVRFAARFVFKVAIPEVRNLCSRLLFH